MNLNRQYQSIITLETETIGDYTFYKFSDNPKPLKIENKNVPIANDRIKRFFDKEIDELKFSDIAI